LQTLPFLGSEKITRCVALGKKEKIPVDQLFGTVVIERTIDLFSLLLIMFIFIFTSSDQIGMFLRESILLPIPGKILKHFRSHMDPYGAILFAISVLFSPSDSRNKRNLRKIRFFAKMFDVAKRNNKRPERQ
jgi:hypothetical protein